MKILWLQTRVMLTLSFTEKKISAFLIKIKFAIIQTRLINTVVVNINKSSAQTTHFQLNIQANKLCNNYVFFS